METKRLYKSKEDKAIFGVCGGLGEYLNLDSIVVRLLFVLLAMVYGGGIVLYILAAIIMPKKPAYAYDAAYEQPAPGFTGYNGQYAQQEQPQRSFSAVPAYDAPAAEASAAEEPKAEAVPEEAAAPAPAADMATEGGRSVAEAASAATAAMAQLTEQLNARDAFEAAAEELKEESAEPETVGNERSEDPKPAEEAPAEEPAAAVKPEIKADVKPDAAEPKKANNDRYDQFQAYQQTYSKPQKAQPAPMQQGQPGQPGQPTNRKSRKTVGLILVLLGALLILKVLVPHIDMKLVWGGAAIIAGLFLMLTKK